MRNPGLLECLLVRPYAGGGEVEDLGVRRALRAVVHRHHHLGRGIDDIEYFLYYSGRFCGIVLANPIEENSLWSRLIKT